MALSSHSNTRNGRRAASVGSSLAGPERCFAAGLAAPEKLAALIGSLDRTKLLAMASKARGLGKPDATRIVAESCMEMVR